MGLPTPPLAPLASEIRRRWDAGARTLAELDPVFWAWLETQQRVQAVQACCVGGGVGLAVIVFVMLALLRWGAA